MRDLLPMPWEWDSLAALGLASGNDTTRGRKKPTKKEEEFARRRWQFLAVVAVGVIGWGAGTGAIPLPGRLGRVVAEEEDDWEEEEEDDVVIVKI